MPTCGKCGGDVDFRHIDGRAIPLHRSGGCGSGFGSSVPRYLRDDTPTSYAYEDVCRPSHCPRCGASVFFVRHNGGSVWFDDLGWPWPIHPCFLESPEPGWFGFIKHQELAPTAHSKEALMVFSVVVDSRWAGSDERGPFRVLLAIEGRHRGRWCLAVHGTNTADFWLGQLVVVDERNRRIVTSNHDVKPILQVPVSPLDLELPEDWLLGEQAEPLD